QTDIWSVGVMLYELISGMWPFPQRDLAPLYRAIASDEPPALSADVPESLKEVVFRALEKEPEKRYRTAKEMREALREVRRNIEIQKERETAQTTLVIPEKTQPLAQTAPNRPALPTQIDGSPQYQILPDAGNTQPPANLVGTPQPNPLMTEPASSLAPLQSSSSAELGRKKDEIKPLNPPQTQKERKMAWMPIIARSAIVLLTIGIVTTFLISKRTDHQPKSSTISPDAPVDSTPKSDDGGFQTYTETVPGAAIEMVFV